MRIAQIAPLAEPVPPDGYGGTERIVSYVTEELVRRGHHVTLFASGDSRTDARLMAPTPRALRRDPGAREPVSEHVQELGMVFGQAERFDVIHSHIDYLAFPAARLSPTPTVHTLHGRLDLPHQVPLFGQFTDVALVSISEAQRAPLRHLPLNWIGTVHHGVPAEEYPYSARADRYLAFVGRMSPEKRPDLAIAVARRARISLKLVAKVDDVDRAYFERNIRPQLDGPDIEFLGEIDETGKRELMAKALALLFPIDWPEPFGLVMIEAMACGTPVIARARGAVPEVVDPGITGFIGETVDDLVAAVKQVDGLDREACRRRANARFTVTRMVDQYEALYRRLAKSRRAA
jgi:glycosyltransferase involved in cell wall biosynthesis